ncbi:4-hydroxy-tetrahydrodipicolinate reductase [Butyrivibrio sp.]|uniref:4-hydroxy-tetrahydrodipicolinate reductase n=1 Tax=Butyrivibrio sp. TaxID=28121 RepID=UPI0025C0959C|nr:4-hydroxy-tetrahydrodipicolinate reductase [Butyrivibrio sp.]MBE5836933.1 4-hydroxy-tetrahydrodipicolinate reductase [Butyrivibrio sp.]MBQ9306006.1 4-hydroxy-tetrahydrodipicolinate reductase [Butyrivibrio sp.]
MTKMIMHGCNGRMGHVIIDLVKEDKDIEVVAGVDAYGESSYDFPVFKSLEECNVAADVIVDFSNASAAEGLLAYCEKTSTPVVLCSTGLSEDQLLKVKETSKKVAVLKSANMSVGVNALMKVLKEVSPLFAAAGFDIEIVEKHHNQKLDAPSGTAIALADSINDSLGNEYEYVYDRSTRREKRPEKEIGISAVRGGTIVGDHDVIFAGHDEVVTLSHRAYSRAIFGKGAIEAAKFLAGKPAGMYDMSDVLA